MPYERKQSKLHLLTRIGILSAVAVALILVGYLVDRAVYRGQSLWVKRVHDFPLTELSGLSWLDARHERLIGVSDREGSWVSAGLVNGRISDVQAVNFGDELARRFAGCPPGNTPDCGKLFRLLTEQWEAVSIDGSGRLFMLQESTGLLYSTLPGSLEGLERFSLLFFPQLAKFKGLKEEPKENALGEGLVLLHNGHLLVSKERGPATLIEFAPGGQSPLADPLAASLAPGESWAAPAGSAALEPVAVWFFPDGKGKCDMSELAITGGTLYILSQRCKQIYRIDRLLPDSRISIVESWSVPRDLTNPEALLVRGRGSFLIGDDKKSKRANLYELDVE